MIGQLLDGRYKIIDTLGAGGFGQTYIAENTRLPGNPKCVIKQFKPTSTDPKIFTIAKRLFYGEAETLVKVGHHNKIPRILDFFDENQEFYLVQDLIEGQQLQTGEVEINQGSSLKLGQAELRVTGITVKQYPPGYQATQYVTEPLKVPSHPVLPTVQPSKGKIQLYWTKKSKI